MSVPDPAEPPRSLQPNPAGDWPQVAPTAFVHPSAQLIGNIHIGPRVLVGPNAVLRADEPGPGGNVEPIEVAEDCNVQDCAVLHALGGTAVRIGPRTSISHAATVHGPCTIGADSFIGFRAVVFDAQIGDGVFVAHGGIVCHTRIASGRRVPEGGCAVSAEQAEALPAASPADQSLMATIVRTNLALAAGYARQRQ